MPTRRFEGPDLESALIRARAELGPDVRVRLAEKVRSGGLGGFFAKERIELEIEVPEPSSDAVAVDPPPPPIPPPATMVTEAPPAAMSHPGEPTVAARPVATKPTAAHAAAAAKPAAAKPVAAKPVAAARVTEPHVARQLPWDVLELAERVNEVEQTVASSEASTRAGRPSEHAPAPAATGPGPADPLATVSTEGPSFAAVFGRILNEAGENDPPPPVPEPIAATLTPAPTVPSAPTAAPVASAPPIAPAPQVATVPAATPIAVPAQPAMTALERLGLPAHLAPRGSVDLRVPLLRQLDRLPVTPALPATKGTVMAIVGARGEATALARWLAELLGTEAESVVVVASRRRGGTTIPWMELTSPEEVGEHRRSWRWRPRPTIVAVDAPLASRKRDWASEVLAGLEPTLAWGITEATRKLEDVAAWSDEMGGFDALVVNDMEATTTPAAILHLGIPVAMFDGQEATAERWADLLLDRLAA